MTEKSSIQLEDERLYNTPEKWYFRTEWLKYAKERMSKNERSFIRFLTLTCSNCYDIKFFRDKGLISMQGTISYNPESVAFCEMDTHRFSLIDEQLPRARKFLGRFENLVGAGRIRFGYEKIDKWFPFDVINLDLLGSVFKKGSRFMGAIKKMLQAQKIKNQSFTLFLTICCVEEGDDESNKKLLRSGLERNLKNDLFREIFTQRYPEGEIRAYNEFLLNTVPKFIIEEGFKESFNAILRGRYQYIGEGNDTLMLGFIFDCEYEEDFMENFPKVYERLKECIQTKTTDINNLLRDNPQLRNSMNELHERYST